MQGHESIITARAQLGIETISFDETSNFLRIYIKHSFTQSQNSNTIQKICTFLETKLSKHKKIVLVKKSISQIALSEVRKRSEEIELRLRKPTKTFPESRVRSFSEQMRIVDSRTDILKIYDSLKSKISPAKCLEGLRAVKGVKEVINPDLRVNSLEHGRSPDLAKKEKKKGVYRKISMHSSLAVKEEKHNGYRAIKGEIY